MTTTDLAISHAQFARGTENPVKTILSCCWISLGLWYEELVRDKIIPGIETLEKNTKLKYWKSTEGSKFRRVIQCRALYVYDILNAE